MQAFSDLQSREVGYSTETAKALAHYRPFLLFFGKVCCQGLTDSLTILDYIASIGGGLSCDYRNLPILSARKFFK